MHPRLYFTLNRQRAGPMYAVCPTCGQPMRIEKAEEEEGWTVCSEVCYDTSSLPMDMRMLPDQATKVCTDGSTHELTRQEYIKTHGFDILSPLWKRSIDGVRIR